MSEPVLLLEDVTKSFPAYRSLTSLLTMRKPPRTGVLDGLHLSSDPGTVTGIVGPNGAGKTTLLRLVTGSLIPDSGRIRVAGTDPVSKPGETAAVTGFMGSSERSFYWRLSVMENLRFFGRLQGLHGTGLEHRMDDVLSMTGSESAASRRFAVLSDGFRRRSLPGKGAPSRSGRTGSGRADEKPRSGDRRLIP